MAEGKDIPIHIKTATDNTGLEQAKQGADQLDEAIARLQASADAAIARIDGLDASSAALAPGLSDVANKAGEAEKAIKDTKDAVQEHGEKSEKAAEKMMMMGQISQGLALGLSNLADVARANGQEELANDLNKVAGAMTLVTTLAASGLHLQTVIAATGGLQASLIALRASATAALVAFGPYIAAIAAGAAAYYALQKAADAYMGTVAEMDAKNERAAIAITGVTITHGEEKKAREAAREEIERYRSALASANDELERNLELAGNEEQLKKAKITADIRTRQAEIDAQTSLYERTKGAQGMNPEEALMASQRLNEEKIQRMAVAEETRRKKEEASLQREVNIRGNDLLGNQTAQGMNEMEINASMTRNNLSSDERRALSKKSKEIEAARQKYGKDSDEVEELMQEYSAIAVKLNDDEKQSLLRRFTLREELAKKIEADQKELDALEKKLEKTQRSNERDRRVAEVENEADVTTSRMQTQTKIEEERARKQEARRMERQEAEERELRGKLPGMENALDRTAAGNRDQLLGTDQARNGPRAKELQSIARQIGEADTTEEIRAIAERFKNMSGGTVELIRGMLAAQERQAKEIENLKSRLNKL
jgi:hypothetical protein